MRSRRTRATSTGPPSRSKIGTGSRPSRARQPDGKRGGAPTGGAGVRRFITPEAYRKKQTCEADARKNLASVRRGYGVMKVAVASGRLPSNTLAVSAHCAAHELLRTTIEATGLPGAPSGGLDVVAPRR